MIFYTNSTKAQEQITSLTSTAIAEKIKTAKERVLFAAPGIFKDIGDSLLYAAGVLPEKKVKVIINPDSSVYYEFLGDIRAVEHLLDEGVVIFPKKNLAAGILVVDNEAFVFSPFYVLKEENRQHFTYNALKLVPENITPLLLAIAPEIIEDRMKKVNLTQRNRAEIYDDELLPLGNEDLEDREDVEVRTIKKEIDDEPISKEVTQKIKKQLEQNPPDKQENSKKEPEDSQEQKKKELLEKVRGEIQIVDIHLDRTKLENHTFNIPKNLLSNIKDKNVKQRFKANYHYFSKEKLKNKDRSSIFTRWEILEWNDLIDTLKNSGNPTFKILREMLSEETKKLLINWKSTDKENSSLNKQLFKSLNSMIEEWNLYKYLKNIKNFNDFLREYPEEEQLIQQLEGANSEDSQSNYEDENLLYQSPKIQKLNRCIMEFIFGDSVIKLTERDINSEKDKLDSEYLRHLKGIGKKIIEKKRIEEFEKKYKQLQTALERYMRMMKKAIESELIRSIRMLADELTQSMLNNPTDELTKILSNDLDFGNKQSITKDYIEEELIKGIARQVSSKSEIAEIAEKISSKMKLTCHYTDVSQQMVEDENFKKALNKTLPELFKKIYRDSIEETGKIKPPLLNFEDDEDW